MKNDSKVINKESMFKNWITLSTAPILLFEAFLSCVGQSPFETVKFEANLFAISNQSKDSIVIVFSYKHLYDIVNDTSSIIKPNVEYDFYMSDFSNGGPVNPQSALNSVSILLIKGCNTNCSFNVLLSGWREEDYEAGNRKGIRFTYIHK